MTVNVLDPKLNQHSAEHLRAERCRLLAAFLGRPFQIRDVRFVPGDRLKKMHIICRSRKNMKSRSGVDL